MPVEWLMDTVRNEIITLIGFLAAAFVYLRKTQKDAKKEKQALQRQIAKVVSDARKKSTRLLVRIGDQIAQAESERELYFQNAANFPGDYLDQINAHLGNLNEMLKRRRAGIDKLHEIEPDTSTHETLIAAEGIADSVENDFVFIEEMAEWNRRAKEDRLKRNLGPNMNK